MRVVALVSGGKDSCYNMMKCVAAGHEIVALANLQPEREDELDSFMFQTVGHEGVSLMAEAMGIPLYRAFTRGKSLKRELNYSPTGGDEVEDLYELLVRVCEECGGVEGVSSGAILSDYQRLRVENVCSRLGLVSLSYLWRREQNELLGEMIEHGVNTIVIKVASMGLDPNKHLGKSIEKMYPDLCRLNEQYGVNVCGEGGEYETFTLDCPLFKRRISLLNSEVVITSPDPYAPVGYLRLTKLLLEDKLPVPLTVTVSTKQYLVSPSLPLLSLASERQSQCFPAGSYVWLAVDGSSSFSSTADQTQQLFEEAWSHLDGRGCEWRDAVLVSLYLADMSDYPSVNSVYKKYFSSEPPARVCVSTALPEGILVRLEVMVCKRGGVEEVGRRSSMHVQSHSEWAPANIGPYSQAFTASGVVFGAGQIGLEPSTMDLVPSTQQASLSLAHVQSVLQSCDSHLTSALYGVCYYTTDEAGWCAKQTWCEAANHLDLSPHCPLLFLPVVALPRGACVEWHFVAAVRPSRVTYSHLVIRDDIIGQCTILESIDKERRNGCWMLPISLEWQVSIDVALKSSLTRLKSHLATHQLSLSDMSYVRVCLPQYGSSQITAQDVCRLCSECVQGDGEVPVSVVTSRGCLGLNERLFVLACRFHS